MRFACRFLSLTVALATLAAQPGPPPGGGFGANRARPGTNRQQGQDARQGQGRGGQSASLTGTAKIEGRVLNKRSGEPIPRATVSLRANDGRQGTSATTDGEGKFIIEDLAAGSYRISAERRGFLRGDFGARRQFQAGSLVTVSDAQEVKGIDVKLEPQSVVSGQVLDEHGEPLERAQVEVMRYRFVQNRQQLMPLGQATTDDLGNFRIWNLPPGGYYLRVQSQGRRGMMMRPEMPMPAMDREQESYVPTYFPGVTELQAATMITLAVGQEFSGVSLQIQKARVYRIRGRVDGLETGQNRMARVMLMPRPPAFNRPFDNSSAIRPDGSFEIGHVLPGSYDLVMMQGGPNQQRFFRTQLEVSNADIENVVLAPGPVFSVQGSVRMEGETKVNLGAMRIMMSMREPGFFQPNGAAKEDGSFQIDNVSADRYFLNLYPLPEGTFVKSIRVSGQDVTRTGLDFSGGAAGRVEVILSDKPASVEGAVEKPSTESLPGTVIVVPEPFVPEEMVGIGGAALRQQASVDQNGRFTIRNLRPGEYRVYAFEEFDMMSGFDPERLKLLQKYGEVVKLGEGETKSLALKQIPPEEGQPQ